MTRKNNLPIGVFDSGMGGLTVLRELKSSLPDESFIYLGDTARLPYGTKSEATIIRYSEQIVNILLNRGIKMLVIACNTASTVALTHLRQQFPSLPIVGVVEPGAKAAVAATRNHHIAVLATETTIKAGGYQAIINHLDPNAKIFMQSCGLFVALAEEGWIDDEVSAAVVKKYLAPIINHNHPHDCVVLGCTHFPVLKNQLQSALGETVSIVDSASATAKAVDASLLEFNLYSSHKNNSKTTLLVTDSPERFIRVGETFLGEPINPEVVDLVEIAMKPR